MSKVVIEAVTFRVDPKVSAEEFAKLAAATRPAVAAMPGFRRRVLSVDAEGTWLDHVEWDSMEDAQAAARNISQQPSFGPFSKAIAAGSVTMRHARLAMVHEAVVDA
ncbi:MAG: antibiotic biosynthesis monooxygenase [Pseudomonadota bacterium]